MIDGWFLMNCIIRQNNSQNLIPTIQFESFHDLVDLSMAATDQRLEPKSVVTGNRGSASSGGAGPSHKSWISDLWGPDPVGTSCDASRSVKS